MTKSCVQVVLIAFAKTLGRVQKLTHGIVFIIVMVVFTLSNMKVPSFNYPRVRMWHVISLVSVCWLSVLTVCDLYTDEHLAYVVLLIIGFGVLALLGLYLMMKKYPAMLYRQKNEAYADILSFAFRPKGDWSIVVSKRNSSMSNSMMNVHSPSNSKKVVPHEKVSDNHTNVSALNRTDMRTNNDQHEYVTVNHAEEPL